MGNLKNFSEGKKKIRIFVCFFVMVTVLKLTIKNQLINCEVTLLIDSKDISVTLQFRVQFSQ